MGHSSNYSNSPLPKKGLQKSIRTASERRTQELDEIPVALLEYALGMAERAEAFDSMVGAHTACTDPAERQIVLRHVHDRAVDGDVADVVRSSTLRRSASSSPK